MRIVIIGTGYVGLVTGTCLASLGLHVVCVDKDAVKIDCLKAGGVPIYEPGLEELIHTSVAAGKLQFTTDLHEALEEADVVFIGVGTPMDPATGQADLKYVLAAAEDIARALTRPAVIVTKSTVPVGTGARIKDIFLTHAPSHLCEIVSNPEFLREGAAIQDFIQADRIIVGVSSPRAEAIMAKLYAPLTAKGVPLVVTSVPTAELTKYAANAFLAMKIAFINEMADLCEVMGADVTEVARGMGLDRRIGPHFLMPGPGYGGSCFPKDTEALAYMARNYATDASLVEAVIATNNRRKAELAEKVEKRMGETVAGKQIAVLGVTFKANTDDVRESPAFPLIEGLLAKGALLKIYDPMGITHAKQSMKHESITWTKNAEAALHMADAAVIVTEWASFAEWTADQLITLMKTPCVIDFRNLYQPEEFAGTAVRYTSVGRPL